jgi:hypothetical protein
MFSNRLDGVVEIEEEDVKIFGVKASMEESSYAFVPQKLSLFWRLSIPLSKCVNLLAWWWSHESQFPNVGFLAKFLKKILEFQIEIKRMFSLASVLIALRHYCLQVENLDRNIFVIKYWPNDPQLNCSVYANFKDYIKAEVALEHTKQDTIKGDGERKDRNNNLNKNNHHNLCTISPLQLPASQSISLAKQKRQKGCKRKIR